jgi:hypothetical protein
MPLLRKESDMEPFGSILVIGAGATAATDLWAIARKRLIGVPAPDWALVGRWIAHMARGRFRHERIAAAAPVRGERAIGWTAHYAIGVAFAAALVGISGTGWLARPALAPALLFGLATVAAPFFLMQPGMGAGIAARRTPRPNAARVQSLITHAVFGLGLYAAALILNFL